MNSKRNSSFVELKTNLNRVFNRIKNYNTKENGYELYKQIILNNIGNKTLLFSLINDIKEKISLLMPIEKPPYINLLSLFFFNKSAPNHLKIYYPYLSPILSILQTQVVDSNSEIFAEISDTYGKIVQSLMPNDINATNKILDFEEKELYEALQNFCIINLKIEQDINGIIGSICLTKLVENCPFVLKNNYMKNILDNILDNISKESFKSKNELLNCLISLILGAESSFCSYAKITLYKILDFLTDKDWLKRKLALNVIYTLIFYCKVEILPLKEHIVNFLHVLKNDKIKEVRDVSISILQMMDDRFNTLSSDYILSDGEIDLKDSENINKDKNFKKVKIIKKKNNNSAKYLKNNKSNDNTKILKASLNSSNNRTKRINVITNSNQRNYNTNVGKLFTKKRINLKYEPKISLQKRNYSFDKRKIKNLKEINGMINKYKEKNKSTDKYKSIERKRSIDKNKSSDSQRNSDRIKVINRKKSIEKNKNIKRNKSVEKGNIMNGIKIEYKGRGSLSRSVNLSKESSVKNHLGELRELRYPKYINRKEDWSFINEKMVIKPDPNKSIFNTNKNMAFFQQSENQNNDVIIISTDNITKKGNTNNKNCSDISENGLNKKENGDEKENFKIMKEKIDKDYENNINNINKLITLDAKIKTDNMRNSSKKKGKENNGRKEDYNINNNYYIKKEDNLNKNQDYSDNVDNERKNINNDANDTQLMKLLLTEVRALSNKQISLLDLMDEVQINTQQQIENLNQKIIDLDIIVRDLNIQLSNLQNNVD